MIVCGRVSISWAITKRPTNYFQHIKREIISSLHNLILKLLGLTNYFFEFLNSQ